MIKTLEDDNVTFFCVVRLNPIKSFSFMAMYNWSRTSCSACCTSCTTGSIFSKMQSQHLDHGALCSIHMLFSSEPQIYIPTCKAAQYQSHKYLEVGQNWPKQNTEYSPDERASGKEGSINWSQYTYYLKKQHVFAVRRLEFKVAE
jgi:hypothetical protein